jgi:hypothetical protein
VQDEESDDDAVVLADERDEQGCGAGPSTSKGKEANGAEPQLKGSKFFSVYDIASEEKSQKKRRAKEAKTETNTKEAKGKAASTAKDGKADKNKKRKK